MKIKVIVLGKLKEQYYVDGVNYYLNDIKSKVDIEIIEINDERLNNKLSDAEISKTLELEEVKVLEKIDSKDYVVALAIKGDISTTESLVKTVNMCKSNNKNLVFIIGSSYGLSDNVYKRANKKMSFSEMTFTHQMMRLILLEQISLCV